VQEDFDLLFNLYEEATELKQQVEQGMIQFDIKQLQIYEA
jgi:hypothetical protein